LEQGRVAEIEAVCQEHPELAPTIRRRLGMLQSVGLIEPARAIGPYRLISELGRGAQAVVHLAEDTRLHRRVALKLLIGLGSASGDALLRF
jgi:serine/threonine protein kinase